MTPAMLDTLVRAVNAAIAARMQGFDTRAGQIKAETLRLESEAGNLVRFLREGKESSTVRTELEATESAIKGLRLELADAQQRVGAPVPQAHRTWVLEKFKHLDQQLNQDPARAKVEIMKHLDGDLTIGPLPAPVGTKRAEITGQIKPSSLLAGQSQEAAFATMVAGVGFEPTTFGL